MLMSRAKKAKGKSAAATNAPKLPQLEEYINKRDYTGALTLLEFNKRSDDSDANALQQTLMWIGYCAFHIGDFQRALAAYTEVWDGVDPPQETHLYIACCQYYLQMYAEAEEEATEGPNCPLKMRVLFHVAHKMNNEQKLMEYHQQLTDTKEDQLCLAAIHYLRNHYQEATDIYKRLLLENRDDLALNVYVAMCYYKLDYYDVSLEILAIYLQSFPDSSVAINLKACNHFRLYNGKAAESELKVLVDQGVNLNDNDLVKHNLVVFLKGEKALSVLPGLLDFVPEAKLNLVIFYLRQNQITEAYDLIKDMEPSTPPEYILKGIVNACVGQATGSREHLKISQQLFQLVGASASESDTIPGRQCMASCFFLLKQFEDVNIYLNSIKAYLYNDDNFNWNFGISSAAVGNYKVAEETLLLVQDETYRQDYTYISWLARCYIHNNNGRAAWDLYLKLETKNDANVLNLIQLIANDCYQTGQFYFAAKAFDLLERHDPDPEYWEGKRGAIVGVFQQVVAGKEREDNLVEMMKMLRETSNPQVEYIMRTITKWCSDNGVKTD